MAISILGSSYTLFMDSSVRFVMSVCTWSTSVITVDTEYRGYLYYFPS